MSSPLPSPTMLILFILLPILLFNHSLSPSVHAQSFRPSPGYGKCYSFVEGQGLYAIGGSGGEDTNKTFTTQKFMLDLSVSWNTSDPIFKKLDGPKVEESFGCSMANSGDELFVLSKGTVYLYNVKSASWTVFQNTNFPTRHSVVATDPETGFIYLPDGEMDFSGENEIALAVDIKTRTVNTTLIPAIDFDSFTVAAWSVPLKSMIVFTLVDFAPFAFTPSEINKPTKGWRQLLSKQEPQGVYMWNCLASAYGGSKMVIFGSIQGLPYKQSAMFIYDLTNLTWKRLPSNGIPHGGACAVTGDQVIVWGGENTKGTLTSTTHVFNLKTEKWVSNYIAPPQPTVTAKISHTSQLSPTSTQRVPYTTNNSSLNDTSSSDKKLVTIIVIVTGVLLATILTVIFVYLRVSKRSKVDTRSTSPDGSSSDSSDIQDRTNAFGTAYPKGSSRRHDPSGFASDSAELSPDTRHRWYSSNLLSWLYRGANGARPPPEHPHAVMEDPEKRHVQEGAVELQIPAQHPHTMVKQGSATTFNDKAEWESIRSYNDKEVLATS